MRRTLPVTLLSAVLAAGPSAGQEPAAPPPPPRVALAPSVGPAGGVVAVPVQFTGREDRPLGSLSLSVRVPEGLTFSKAEIGGLGIAFGVEATTSRAPGKDAAKTLRVTLAAPAADGVRPALPDGPLAQLVFTVAKTLKPETVLSLTFDAAGAGVRAGGDPVPVGSVAGQVVVANPTVISCFFYMH